MQYWFVLTDRLDVHKHEALFEYLAKRKKKILVKNFENFWKNFNLKNN